ncbi:MAG TPA: TM0106 family RecB-like putative nuclease [Candidatus Acidoferrum sp.]|nr:TM0106 family RecB-like putative nuclease [Candidatus Acidoferrum sp.]
MAGERWSSGIVQLHGDTVVVSATDLVGYLACDHLVTLELGHARGELERPPQREDPELLLLQERGQAHELAYLERLREAGRSIHEIERRHPRTPDDLRAAEEETLDAMRRGVDVIYQATFFDGRWRGHADFLLRNERASDLGPWSYDVADTKLARGVKAGAILQVCVYADRLTALQGTPPERLVIVTGDGQEHHELLADYAAFYRTVKRRFEDRVFGDAAAPATYPDPVDHCRVCVWFPTCMDRRRADDHLSIVAGMTRLATERLVDDDIPTLASLAGIGDERLVVGMNPRPLRRLRDQARIQLDGRLAGRLLYDLIVPDPEAPPDHGLAALPEPSPYDVFFDIEADPWAMDDGLEYLLGVSWRTADGTPDYRPIWGHDRTGEKQAFEEFVDFVIGRLDRDPRMHVYHYAGYESGAIKRLVQRHATREDEVDRILRGRVLVDLYQVVRQGIRASVESYSIKKIEKFYMPHREGPITEAGFSVVEYERWLRDSDPQHLADLADYNRDDCVSTLFLRDWLEGLRTEGIMRRGWNLPRRALLDGSPPEALIERQSAARAREAALRVGIPDDPAERTLEQAGRWLLSGLVDWHRRDAKPAWWEHFRLAGLSVEDLLSESGAIAGLEYVGEVRREKQSIVHRYRFDPRQDTKIKVGDADWTDPATETDGHMGTSAGTVVALDLIDGTIDLKRAANSAVRHPAALIEPTPISYKPLPEAMGRVADFVIKHGLAGPGPYRAARELILREPPRIAGMDAGEMVRRPGENALDTAVRLGLDLGDSVLAIQGPPGTGKTWTGARMIVALVAAGRKLGVTAQSHKAITNMIRAIDEAAAEAGRSVRVIQKCDSTDDGAAQLPDVTVVDDSKVVGPALDAGRYDVAAGTCWLFGREDMLDKLDVLFVDEAGQLSLANVVAAGGCARSIVLLGDPNQLPQVSPGVHPEGAGASALEHLVGAATTIAPDRGLLLDVTYRMHPAVNDFVSEVFYAGRLAADPSTARQLIVGRDGMDELGIRYRPVEHDGDAASSRREAAAVADAVDGLVGQPWTDRFGVTRPLTLNDILVVAPYNAHVGEIERVLVAGHGERGRVGTVDRFQGQEAPVAVYSMATSSPDEIPRGIEFLYSRNRFNVAVSRARGLSILVCSPELLRVRCRTPEQMRLANALCRYVEMVEARTETGGAPRPAVDATVLA